MKLLTRWRKVATAALVSLVAAAGLVVPSAAPAVASAGSAWAWNTRSLLLRFPAPLGAAACVHRQIWLGSGSYRWELGNDINGWGYYKDSGRDIVLGAGNYLWQDCIYRFEAASGGDPYIHYSYLDRQNGQPPAAWNTFIRAAPGSRQVTYGSYLRPI